MRSVGGSSSSRRRGRPPDKHTREQKKLVACYMTCANSKFRNNEGQRGSAGVLAVQATTNQQQQHHSTTIRHHGQPTHLTCFRTFRISRPRHIPRASNEAASWMLLKLPSRRCSLHLPPSKLQLQVPEAELLCGLCDSLAKGSSPVSRFAMYTITKLQHDYTQKHNTLQ